ncbi:MAG TPA: hypothetical protein VK987_00980 [Anaerolineae bacterium]|jgi:hypothetical protein|nr:hypothetical protein [Anaerolineae bacterium]
MKNWLRAVLAYPPTWVAVAAVVAGVVAIIVLLEPPMLLTIAVIVIGVAAIAAWPITLSAMGTLQRLQYRAPQLPAVNELELRGLADDLDRLEDPRPAYQLQAIGEKRDNLVAILGRRMDAGELTYSRYQSTAQQVYLAVVSNLREVAIAKRSVSAIDTDYIDARLHELRTADPAAAQAEITSLEDRRALAVTQEAKVTYLLAQNESAMTLLDRTSTALADAPIGLTPQATEAALDALKELADRAGRYAT